jgi:2-polyprenyl-6-methoxyphenol hydroxylase-like FAD-dependent oxidoreductase
MAELGRILIVGGGLAGLTAASALRQRGFHAELIERDPRWQPIGAGIAVQPNAMRVLRQLDLAAAVESAGAPVRRWQFIEQQGDVLCDIDLSAVWGDVAPFVGIERAKLHDALLGGDLSYRLGLSVASLSQTERCVSVAFSDGTAGEYDLVIGADGIRSSVRQFAFGPVAPIYGGQMVWRSLAPFRQPELDAVQFWLGDGCFFGLCPVGGNRTYGFANVTTPRLRDEVKGRLGRLRQRFAGFGRTIRDYLDSVAGDEQLHCAPIEWLDADRWCSGRVVLIGDAAHATSPMMGQGGSMAMEDALVLAETLHTASDLQSALERFVARRRARVNWVAQQSRAVGEMLCMPPSGRDAAIRERGERAFHERFRPLTAPL